MKTRHHTLIIIVTILSGLMVCLNLYVVVKNNIHKKTEAPTSVTHNINSKNTSTL